MFSNLCRRSGSDSFEIHALNQMSAAFYEEYRLPIVSIKSILSRKELKLAIWERSLYPWEQQIFGGSLSASCVFQNRLFRSEVTQIAKEYFPPKIEKYYNMKTRAFYLFLGNDDRPSLYQFAACQFFIPQYYPGEADDEHYTIEERLSASVAKGIKASIGRGPKTVRVYVVSRNIVVYIFHELWGEVQRKSCLGNDEVCRSMEDYFNKIVVEVIAPEQKREIGVIVEYHMDFDVEKNALAVIAISGPVI